MFNVLVYCADGIVWRLQCKVTIDKEEGMVDGRGGWSVEAGGGDRCWKM